MVYKKKVIFSKKKLPLSKTEAKAVAQIAKKVNNKQAETKSAASNALIYPGLSDIVRVQNLNYFMTQGVSDNSFIGSKIHLKNINLRCLFRRHGSANLTGSYNEAVLARIVIFSTKKQLTTSQVDMTASDLFRTDGITSKYATLPFIDRNKVRLHYDKVINLTSPNPTSIASASPANERFLKINIKVNSNKLWDSDNSGFFKYGNYYAAVVYSSTTDIPNYVSAQCNWVFNFKDE